MRDRYLILGEAPGGGRHRSGGTATRRIRDLAERDLEEWADWINLIEEWPGPARGGGSAWNARAAAARAAELRPTLAEYRGVICLGRRVGQAMIPGGSGFPFFRWIDDVRGARLVVIPHPSGVSRWWNEPANVVQAKVFLRDLASGIRVDKTVGSL